MAIVTTQVSSSSATAVYPLQEDSDVRAIEIAWYKLCEKQFGEIMPDFQYQETGMALLYGDEIENVHSFSRNEQYYNANSVVKYIVRKLDNNKYLQHLDFSTVCENAVLGSAFSVKKVSNVCYKNNLIFRGKILKENGYSSEEVDEAIRVCNTRQSSTGQDEGCTTLVNIPTKNGGIVGIYGAHSYTVAGTKDGYVQLRNPHNSAEVFEVSEIYVKLLFNTISYVK